MCLPIELQIKGRSMRAAGVPRDEVEDTVVSNWQTAWFSAQTADHRYSFSCNSSDSVFHCDDRTCVSPNNVCNGIPECLNGKDESVAVCGCLPNEFRCSNSCVDLVKRCDRHKDCEGGEDEQECNTYLCPVTHFKCTNHFCIPLDSFCDFKDDCGDNSDEIMCERRKCWNPEFRCGNGECIRPGFLCDGHPECYDGSDESEETCHPSNFVRCGDGTKIHKYYWCDDWPDCSDNHADELNCKSCDGEEDFLCPNGRCIRRANVCDSQCDCVNSFYYNKSFSDSYKGCADEINCSYSYTTQHGVALCHVGSALSCSVPASSHSKNRCIAQKYICDGFNDCHNGDFFSDEFGCGSFLMIDEKTFQCRDNRTLPAKLRCDNNYDCLHGDDEEDCPEKPNCAEEEFQCKNGQCIPVESSCNLIFDCSDKSDELNCSNMICGEGMMQCTYSGQCLLQERWCDFFIDCPDESDESNCSMKECGSDEFRCDNGQCVIAFFECYNPGDSHTGCADRSHLLHCQDWKCQDGQFKCHQGPCLNMSLLCDRNIDCPGSWEDEDNCTFSCSTLAPECECRDVHMNCTGLGISMVPDAENEITAFHLGSNFINRTLNNITFQRLDRLLYLDLSNNSITELYPHMFCNLWRLTLLNLQNNKITVLANSSFYGLPSVTGLYLQGNEVHTIQAMAFYGLSALTALDLHGQKIKYIEPEAFMGLRNLAGLDLSRNEIEYLEELTLRGLSGLLSLDLSKNKIRLIAPHVFLNTPIMEKLITDEFRFCCLARHVNHCEPPRDEFSSCEDLMSNLVLRVCVWVLATVATFGNILVIAWRSRYKHCNQVHSFLITNLALGDLLMGSYLLLIAFVDWHYRGVYFIHDSNWRSSQLCAFAGFISTFSSELSVFTLTVITLDRFLGIIFPFRVRRLKMARTRQLMAFGWLLSGTLSALPLSHFQYFHNFYGRSGVCLALHITPDKPNGWEYSVFVFLILNLVSFSIIALGYLWMFIVARTTQKAVNKERQTSETAMAWRMTLLVATDAACWVPIILLGIVSLAGYTVPPQVFAWVAVFVLPLNAAINPVLYTLSTAPFLTPARRGLLRFRRSCKLSLSADPRRTYSSAINTPLPIRRYSGCSNAELYSVTKRTSARWSHHNMRIDTTVSERGEVVPLNRIDK
ncbi:G-protein coupled receptor GRL101-like [Lycorma delicatula]|uniref:G-protein coupled receptor GRL101-like n=1 Tax=Lycorma delicatula TaxID=130591 RepID=UPI003F50F6CB